MEDRYSEYCRRCLQLMRAVTLWNEVIEDSNYSSIKDNEDFVASEVHSRPAGSNGAEYFRAAVQHTIGESNGPMETAEKAEQESWSGQEMADIKQEEVPETETSSRAWTANEDKSSSAPGQLQGPKLLFSIKKNKDVDNLAQFSRNKGHLGDHEFLYELAKLVGFKGDNLNHSFYANLDNGNDLRIADHSGNAQNYRNIGNAAGVHHGVVIKLSPARFKSIKGIRYKEYV